MKSFIFLVVALFSINSFAILTSFNSNSKDGLGEVKHYDKIFITVQATDNDAFVVGEVVVLDNTVDDGMVVRNITTQTRRPLCVVVEAIAAKAFGKCQVYGYNSAVLFDAGATAYGSVATAGDQVYISGSVAGYAAGAAASSHYPSIGEFLDSDATSGTAEVFIRGL